MIAPREYKKRIDLPCKRWGTTAGYLLMKNSNYSTIRAASSQKKMEKNLSATRCIARAFLLLSIDKDALLDRRHERERERGGGEGRDISGLQITNESFCSCLAGIFNEVEVKNSRLVFPLPSELKDVIKSIFM